MIYFKVKLSSKDLCPCKVFAKIHVFVEQPTHQGPVSPRNTLLTLDLPHIEHPSHSMKDDIGGRTN